VPCFTPVLGPIALILGIFGLRAIRRKPGLPGKAHAWVGVVLGAIEVIAGLIVLLFVAGLVAAARRHR